MRKWQKIVMWLGFSFWGLMGLSGCEDSPKYESGPPTIHLPAGEVALRPPGKTWRAGRQVSPEPVRIHYPQGVIIMQRQVSQAEYVACVASGACNALDTAETSPDRPVTGVNWHDATAYAAWLSARTGQLWRLPTYAEWVYAAGELFRPEALVVEDDNPAQQWLAAYEEEIRRQQQQEDTAVRPFGDYGRNAAGLLDINGSVWEWTNDCYTLRITDTETVQVNANCGVRVAAGRHTAYITDFIRDPKNGACSVGAPPAHMGLRLVLAQTDT